jgi:hypothetical protein
MLVKHDSIEIKSKSDDSFTFNNVTFFGDEHSFYGDEPDCCFDFESIEKNGKVIAESEVPNSIINRAITYCIEGYLYENSPIDWEGFQEWLEKNEGEIGYPEPIELHDF